MAEKRNSREPIKKKHQKTQKKPHHGSEEKTPLRSFFSCKDSRAAEEGSNKKKNKKKKKYCRRIGCSGSLCSMKDNPGVIQKPVTSPTVSNKRRALLGHSNSSSRSMKAPLSEINGVVSSSSSSHSSSSIGGSFRGLHLRRFSGCYECHMVVDPISGVPSLRTTIFPCPDCEEIFMKSESLELHQQVRHAVSELGPEDTSRNIVEIIFQSSWLKKQSPVCKIDRILKVHNTQKTISRFEDYRDTIKTKATKIAKKHPRCIADGNELLRFYCTNVLCSLGLNGSTNLCDSIPHCTVCSIVRDGFKADSNGKIRTMATSGRAHDAAKVSPEEEKRAMLVCRVIAGRVKRSGQDVSEEYDSVTHSNLDELILLNPRAILPCFVVIYRGF